MTDFHNTFLGDAIADLAEFFGVSKAKADANVDNAAAKLKADAEALFNPIIAEILTLGQTALPAILNLGMAAIDTALVGKNIFNIKNDVAVFEAALNTVKTETMAIATLDAPMISLVAQHALAGVLVSHAAVKAAAAPQSGADTQAAGGTNG